MNIQEALTEYQFRNVGQFRGIASSLGYKEEYNKGDLRFSRGGDDFRTTVDKIRSYTKHEPDLPAESASMERICKFFDRDSALLPEYKEALSKEGVDIINWGDLKGDVKDRFTVIDHKNKICYTGKEMYEYALGNGYLLDGKGTQLEKGVLSALTDVKGKPAKVRLTENGISIHYRKESLVIPDSIFGKKLSKKQQQCLLNGDVIVLPSKKGDIFLQVDKDLNAVVVRSEKELSIPAEIGGYELTPADKYLLANGFSLDNKILHGDSGYFIADVSMNADKKGYAFSNIQMISATKAKELLEKKDEPAITDQYIMKNPQDRDLEAELKEAVVKNDYEKLLQLKEEGYKPSEEVIKGLGDDSKIDEKQAVVIEKIFGIKPEVSQDKETLNADQQSAVTQNQENTKSESASPELEMEFREAIAKDDFEKMSQLKEQGYQPSKELLQSLDSVPDNTMIAVQKIFGMKTAAPILNDVKLTQSQPDKDLTRPLATVVNRVFSDL